MITFGILAGASVAAAGNFVLLMHKYLHPLEIPGTK